MLQASKLQLLHQLYAIHAPTYHEWSMIALVREYVATHIPDAKVQMDSWGNLYIVKGDASVGYPTLVCHLDQVQTIHSEDFEVRQEGDMLYGWSEKNQQREGLGADDKNGIYICLRCLEECPCLKVFMAVGEEKGCIGTNHADMSFFHDSLYVLEPDCKGAREVHVNLKGIPCASDEFIKALQLEANDYVLTDGRGSDIFVLTLNSIGVSCANIPCGYHLPHKDDEYTLISELEHTLDYIKTCISRLNHRFPHIYQSETQKQVAQWLSS